ncbi:Ser/Thr protein phosphatase [Tritrichomonas foetus]|uniref:protein-serine/threonine phosphatase n=1 Tax=Tritrichomonas foetus TaxID=1144522 RepID=A0A1J4KAL1_9EUKA|nr:Ser/Thr protein phosphatase [Tritrichomonas foetus]|eukprot:OHT06485.1 Ser/Thr protein phosphatase [Tritrichomonas foetus]
MIPSQISVIYSDVISQCNGDISNLGTVVPIPCFTESILDELCVIAINHLKVLPSLLLIDNDLVIVGDIYGNLHNLLHILMKFGFPPSTRYLFLGNYVDYGNYSLEVATLLLSLSCAYPDHVFLLKGESESFGLQVYQGFYQEVVSQFGNPQLWSKFINVFEYLPVATLIQQSILCAQMGILERYSSIGEISVQMRPLRIPKLADAFTVATSQMKNVFSEDSANEIADKYNTGFIVSGSCPVGESIAGYADGRIYAISACESAAEITVLPIFIGHENDFSSFESIEACKREDSKFSMKEVVTNARKKISIVIPKTISSSLLNKKITPQRFRKVSENKSMQMIVQ